jgi:hypothetical protein
MLKRMTYLTMAAGLALPLAAGAAPLTYNFVELDYLDVDLGGASGDGFGIGGSFQFSDNWFFLASYGDVDFDPGSLERVVAGFGYKHAVSETTSLFGDLTYQDFDGPGGSVDGYGVDVGVRHAMLTNLELNGGLNYIDLGSSIDGEVGFNVGGTFYFTPSFGLGINYGDIDDVETLSAGVTFDFGGT